MNKTYVQITGRIKTMSPRAICYVIDPDGEAQEKWIPKSCCRDGYQLAAGDEDIEIAEWFCVKEGIDP